MSATIVFEVSQAMADRAGIKPGHYVIDHEGEYASMAYRERESDSFGRSVIATRVERGDTCPRCGIEARLDAVSRWDNATLICAGCGVDEGMAVRLLGGTGAHPRLGARRWTTMPVGLEG